MSYKVNISDFLEITSRNQLSSTSLRLQNFDKRPEIEMNLSVNEEIIKKDLSIVQANYLTQEDLVLDCTGDDNFLELHFNLSKDAISYKNHFNYSDKVPSMTGNLIYVAPNDEKSFISFKKNVEYKTFDIHFPLCKLTDYDEENAMLDIFLNQVSQKRCVGLTDNNIKVTPKILCAIQDICCCPYEGLTRKIYLESKIGEILAFSFDNKNAESIPKLSNRDIEGINFAAKIIEDHISNPITIDELAKAIGINKTKLKYGFKKVFGTTVFGYLQELRMNKAKQYINDSHLTIDEISQDCGYTSISNFSAAFKKHFGYSPSFLRSK